MRAEDFASHLTRAQWQLAVANTRKEALETEIVDLGEIFEAAKKELEETTAELNQTRAQLSDTVEQLTKLQGESRDAMQTIKQLREDYAKASA